MVWQMLASLASTRNTARRMSASLANPRNTTWRILVNLGESGESAQHGLAKTAVLASTQIR
jgi:hypothetical protein